MCGITGYFCDEEIGQDVFARMQSIIRHRGPDDAGSFVRGNVGIANLRLSIIDVDGGHQPFISEDGSIAVVQNGEIYNHVELAAELENSPYECRTRSDTEVLLRLYQKEGIGFVSRLNGMFSIAIYDDRSKELFLVRDRVGVKPLFWHKSNGRLIFGSEIKAILAAGVENEVDMGALHAFLSFNYVPPPATMFRNIRHVMPGTFLRISQGKVEEKSWWRLADSIADRGTVSVNDQEFLELLGDSVRLRMRCDVPFGAFLSGGVDSSAVVATMSAQSDKPPQTFCIGFDDKRFDESPYAEQLAARVGAQHTTSIVEHNMLDLWPAVTYFNDQPHGDVSFMPTFRVSELAVEQVKVVLTGDGGDELFAGYDKYRDFFSKNPSALTNRSVFLTEYADSLRLFSPGMQKRFYSGELARHAEDIVVPSVESLLRQAETADGINLALYIDCMWLLPGNNLVKPDRMGMANSLEARTPFLDYRIVEWAFRLDGAQKLANGVTKVALKRAVSDLIGEDLAYRRKQMFTVPIGEWLKQRASALAHDVLFDKATIDRGLFDPGEVRRALEDHIAGRANHTRELRALIALELWFRIFIDRATSSAPDWQELGFSNSLAA